MSLWVCLRSVERHGGLDCGADAGSLVLVWPGEVVGRGWDVYLGGLYGGQILGCLRTDVGVHRLGSGV